MNGRNLRTAAQRALLALVLGALVACGGPDARPMTRSAADAPSRVREETRTTVAVSGADADGYEATAEAPPEPAAAPEPASSDYESVVVTESSDSAGSAGGVTTGGEYRESERPSAPSRSSSDDDSPSMRSVETLSGYGDASTASVTERVLNIGALLSVEPLAWVPLDPSPLPAGPRRVLLASLELPPGAAVFPPSSACQDVLLYLSAGVLEASGTGIGTLDAPASLYAGDAARFGPEGDARIENVGTETARALLAIARREGAGAPLYTVPEEGDRCPAFATPDPLVRPMRVASRATSETLSLDAHLDVQILLDVDGTGAMHAGLAFLSGDAETRVAPHVHDTSAELLFIEDGAGVMHIAERTLELRPGIVVYVPEGVTHSFEPSGTRPLVALQVYAPSGPEQRFRGLASR